MKNSFSNQSLETITSFTKTGQFDGFTTYFCSHFGQGAHIKWNLAKRVLVNALQVTESMHDMYFSSHKILYGMTWNIIWYFDQLNSPLRSTRRLIRVSFLSISRKCRLSSQIPSTITKLCCWNSLETSRSTQKKLWEEVYTSTWRFQTFRVLHAIVLHKFYFIWTHWAKPSQGDIVENHRNFDLRNLIQFELSRSLFYFLSLKESVDKSWTKDKMTFLQKFFAPVRFTSFLPPSHPYF